MFLLLYLFSLILGGVLSLTQCEQGYLSFEGCGSDVLVSQVFSGAELTFGIDTSYVGALGADGYAVRNYLVPIDASSSGNTVLLLGTSEVYGSAPDYGLSHQYLGRSSVVWSALLDSYDLYQLPDLSVALRSVPSNNAADATENAANDAQYAVQAAIRQDILYSSSDDTSGTCAYYNEDILLGSPSSTFNQVLQNFSEVFSDAAFSCTVCAPPTVVGQLSTQINFDGTMWVARSSKPNGLPYSYSSGDSFYSCTSIDCMTYPYAFLNYQDEDASNSSMLLEFSSTCPINIGYMSKSPNIEQSQTLLAMTYANLLSNSLLDPSLGSFPIQTGFSGYGGLFFNAQLVSSSQAFWMVLIGMMIMNGFWPMAGKLCVSMLISGAVRLL
jgi:hypothetical protein